MTSFAFATATRIVFGPGCSAQLPDAVAGLGARPFVCTGATPDRFGARLEGLDGARSWPIAGEPTLDDVRAAAAAAREHGTDVIVGLGGGAVLDAAKLVAALVPNDGDVLDYVEVIGAGRSMGRAPLPFVAVPTTAGTGSEVTMNGVVTSPEHGVKVSMRHPSMLARLALVDPELTLSCPPAVTASSGLDALTHCLESFVSPLANPLTDGFAAEGLRRAGRSQRRAYTDGDDLDARTDMALCSLLGGLALANAKLGAVHGLAGVVGGLTGAPHGLTCATLLVECCRGTVAALRERAPEDPTLARYAEAGALLSGTAGVDALLDWLAETVRILQVPTIGRLGVTPEQYPQICKQAAASSSMKGNPIVLSAEELEEILRRSA